jgi:hypothetical protein
MQPNAPDDLVQYFNTINRHLHGLTVAFEALERAMQEKYPPRTDGERAAQQAREVVYRQGGSEVKVIRD